MNSRSYGGLRGRLDVTDDSTPPETSSAFISAAQPAGVTVVSAASTVNGVFREDPELLLEAPVPRGIPRGAGKWIFLEVEQTSAFISAAPPRTQPSTVNGEPELLLEAAAGKWNLIIIMTTMWRSLVQGPS